MCHFEFTKGAKWPDASLKALKAEGWPPVWPLRGMQLFHHSRNNQSGYVRGARPFIAIYLGACLTRCNWVVFEPMSLSNGKRVYASMRIPGAREIWLAKREAMHSYARACFNKQIRPPPLYALRKVQRCSKFLRLAIAQLAKGCGLAILCCAARIKIYLSQSGAIIKKLANLLLPIILRESPVA